MRLAMSILCRDEADIIEHSVRYHADSGVDCFVITDNGSRDGTREILEQLKGEYEIEIIDEPSLTVNSDLWVSRMHDSLRNNHHADWIINSDADEFWVSDTLGLKPSILQALSMAPLPEPSISAIHCDRNNMITSREMALDSNYSFLDNIYKVLDTLSDYDRPGTWHENNSNTLIKTLPGKSIERVESPLTDASLFNNLTGTYDEITSTAVRILHFPVRSYHQFEKKVVNFGRSLERNKRFAYHTNQQMLHWFNLYQQGELMYEYMSIVLPEARLQELLESGKLCIDDSLLVTKYQRNAA